jgi:glyoxylase-like metal-dependent hydrolase (beta-lactamase superfamily II)
MNEPATAGESTVTEFVSSSGARVYQLPYEAFPGLSGYVYLVLAEQTGQPYRVLIDTGSGLGDSDAQIVAGLAQVGCSPADLTHIFITHGHIDHFGGLAYFAAHSPARIGVHELDRRILTHYEERLTVILHRLEEYLAEAGVAEARRAHLLDMYRLTKSIYHSVRVDFTYEAVGMAVGPFRFLHTPGHCAGHVVIRLDDLLFSGDHVLAGTSPHQSPEQITLSTGLDHYLRSLAELRGWAAGVRLTLGGHKAPITDLDERIRAIEALHQARLAAVLAALDTPRTIAEISRALFGEVHGYNVLLALEEAGAHVEYLYQRGLLGIANLTAFESTLRPVPLEYCRLPEAEAWLAASPR